MKTKLTIELPTREKLLAGLEPRTLHPTLVKTEQAAEDAEHLLEQRRRDLADRERIVAELPARIQSGAARASALTDAMRERDAAAMLIPPAETALAKARERIVVEEKNAKLAVDREFARRCEHLERVAVELRPVLDELGDLATALANARGGGWFSVLEWSCSPCCGAVSTRGVK